MVPVVAAMVMRFTFPSRSVLAAHQPNAMLPPGLAPAAVAKAFASLKFKPTLLAPLSIARAKHKAISQGANMLFAYSDAKRPALEGIVAEALSQSQLEMGYPVDRLGPTLVVPTLCGYALRTYQAGDESAWYLLMERAGFGVWNAERLRS